MKKGSIVRGLAGAFLAGCLLSGCQAEVASSGAARPVADEAAAGKPAGTARAAAGSPAAAQPAPDAASGGKPAGGAGTAAGPSAAAAVPAGSEERTSVEQPDSVLVLVNKQHALPEGYKPSDLVEPDVPFLFKEHLEKRLMRKEAAAALEKLFAGARQDGIELAGVSAFRSFSTQRAVFGQYVRQDGEDKARSYSAVPGTSEHQTGLAIDLSGRSGACAATDCFDGTPEARWIAEHSYEYGFILRYPKGQEALTGYQYEPWHIRYVGVKAAADIFKQHLTLEQYLGAL
ncbi:D-alanyl-D-alanine carboxypeptidase family protein [Paenibacillus sp. TAB 01]|uniref:M15 family metallopeptidase n=1 Tax=Paenibacillus sp. TAB 01 TaxID=3368988 RepID=UPI003751A4E2